MTLADSIHRAAMDKALANRLAQHGLERAHSHFTLGTMLASYETLIQGTAGRVRRIVSTSTTSLGS
jgi:hypothetical protein